MAIHEYESQPQGNDGIYSRGKPFTAPRVGVSPLRSISEHQPQGPFCEVPDPIRLARERTKKYDIDLTILSRLLFMDGVKSLEDLEAERQDTLVRFKASDRSQQIEAHDAVREMVDVRLPVKFNSYLRLFEQLLDEGGTPHDQIQIAVQDRKKKFQNRPRMEMFEAMMDVKSETDKILMERVSGYIRNLKEFLIRTGRSEKDVDLEVGKWQYRYDITPDDIKPMTANLIRRRLNNAAKIEFGELLLDYKIEATRGVVPKRGGFIDPQEWSDKFYGVESPDRQIDVIRALRYVVEKHQKDLQLKLATAQVHSSII